MGCKSSTTVTELSANNLRLLLAPVVVADGFALLEDVALGVGGSINQASSILTRGLAQLFFKTSCWAAWRSAHLKWIGKLVGGRVQPAGLDDAAVAELDTVWVLRAVLLALDRGGEDGGVADLIRGREAHPLSKAGF